MGEFCDILHYLVHCANEASSMLLFKVLIERYKSIKDLHLDVADRRLNRIKIFRRYHVRSARFYGLGYLRALLDLS